MPTNPYAQLLISVNGDTPVAGGRTAANGDTITLSFESTVGWPASPPARLEIYSYPEGYTGPGGDWSEEETTIAGPNGETITYTAFVYENNTPPDPFTLPAGPLWGKFLLSLKVNNGQKNGQQHADMFDQSGGLEIESPEGLHDIAWREGSQFSTEIWRKWSGDLAENLRTIDTALGSAVSPSVTLTAGAGLTGGGDLSANRTFDVGAGSGITVNANDVAVTFGATGEMAAAANANSGGATAKSARIDHTHALPAASGGAAGTMSAADFTKLAGLPSSAPATTLTLTAGTGMTGGGDLSANRTFNVVANADGSIVVNADDIQVGVLASDAQHGNRGGGALHANATGAVAGFMSSTDKAILDGATSTPTANRIVKYDGSDRVNAASYQVSGVALNAQHVVYTADNASHWAGSAPTNVGDAIDRMAALLFTLNGDVAIP